MIIVKYLQNKLLAYLYNNNIIDVLSVRGSGILMYIRIYCYLSSSVGREAKREKRYYHMALQIIIPTIVAILTVHPHNNDGNRILSR